MVRERESPKDAGIAQQGEEGGELTSCSPASSSASLARHWLAQATTTEGHSRHARQAFSTPRPTLRKLANCLGLLPPPPLHHHNDPSNCSGPSDSLSKPVPS